MDTLLKKGYDKLTRADGGYEFKPFAIYLHKGREKKFYIASSSSLYVLNERGYITRNSLKEASDLLDQAIALQEKWNKADEDRKIISSETIYID